MATPYLARDSHAAVSPSRQGLQTRFTVLVGAMTTAVTLDSRKEDADRTVTRL